MPFVFPGIAVVSLLVLSGQGRAQSSSAADLEFFERTIRPLLVDQCLSCHGAKKQEAGLRLDSRAAILKGSDSGPVVAPGDPAKSKLIAAIRHDGGLKMPKDGKKLSANEIVQLSRWVQIGVPFPASLAVESSPKSDPRRHWAFQPVKAAQPPACKIPTQPLDSFVQSKLEEKGLSFSPVADKRTLVRRAYFDLLGMPPTAEQIDEFSADQSPNAFERLVDRLLASPQYGEVQARHWLDLARYADTKGYVFQEDRNYPFAYTYRDWVIRAFNEDMPYDRFLILQIAADRMNSPDQRDLAALGFQTLGRRFLNNVPDIIDDRLDVTFRTTLGLTIACARCHDHKFDPIPTKDYYSLYGVFASSVEPKELPAIGAAPQTPEAIEFEKQLRKLEDEAKAASDKIVRDKLVKLRGAESVAAYMLAVGDARGKRGEEMQRLLRQRDLTGLVFDRWRTYLEEQTRGHSSVFAAWKALSAIPAEKFTADAAKSALAVLAADAKTKYQPLDAGLLEALLARKPASLKEVAGVYGSLIATSESPALKAVLGNGGPLDISPDNANRLFNTADRNKITELRRKADAFKATSPHAPPRAMVLNDSPNLFNPYVFLRGNPGNRGPAVPRQFLEILSGPRKPFTEGSGRLELARAIADPKNPLTARVMVNRVWSSHFGQGLVRTPSDFGVRTEPPTHPELLDWLARNFMDSGWSVKKLHRVIMLSRTYQQTSEVVDAGANAEPRAKSDDPENRLLSRMNRRRFDFEALRDGLLLAAGHLDVTMGGKPVDIFKEPFSHRRTIYCFVDRQNLPGTFRIFDFASPDNHSPQRFTTTVPQQALFLLNSPFVSEQTRALVARPAVATQNDPAKRIEQLYRIAYGRLPSKDETRFALTFINGVEVKVAEATGSPWQYGFGNYSEESRRAVSFSPMPHFNGSAWQGGPTLPDRAHGWASLNAQGGHPGKNPDHAVIRRWIAPCDGEIAISGALKHPDKQGDGVRGRIVSSRAGALGAWKVKNNQVEIELRTRVAKGDTIDFMVDCLAEESFDAFAWTPRIRQIGDAKETTWDAAREFAGPASGKLSTMSRWEMLAQVLLLSNEFAFVD